MGAVPTLAVGPTPVGDHSYSSSHITHPRNL